MKKLIFTLFLTTSCIFAAYSQSYKSAIGLRLGYPLSISYKHFINERGALEGLLGFRGYSFYRSVNVGLTYQYHSPIDGVDGLKWYAGGGVLATFWSFDKDFFYDNQSNVNIGIAGVLGLDYKFADAPLNLSIDWMPVFGFTGYRDGFYGGYTALSARYILK